MSFDDRTSRIGADPFATPVEAREPARRLRGRLAAPVTVWTSRTASGGHAGITISSVLIAAGEPPEVLGLVDPLSDFYDAVHHSERFVLHVLTSAQARLAESFAFRIPGDPFDGEPVSTSAWGPVLGSVPTRAGCRLVASSEAGYSRLLRARIEEIVLDERAARPLVHYRGGYVSVGPRQD